MRLLQTNLIIPKTSYQDGLMEGVAIHYFFNRYMMPKVEKLIQWGEDSLHRIYWRKRTDSFFRLFHSQTTNDFKDGWEEGFEYWMWRIKDLSDEVEALIGAHGFEWSVIWQQEIECENLTPNRSLCHIAPNFYIEFFCVDSMGECCGFI